MHIGLGLQAIFTIQRWSVWGTLLGAVLRCLAHQAYRTTLVPGRSSPQWICPAPACAEAPPAGHALLCAFEVLCKISIARSRYGQDVLQRDVAPIGFELRHLPFLTLLGLAPALAAALTPNASRHPAAAAHPSWCAHPSAARQWPARHLRACWPAAAACSAQSAP